MAPAPYIVLATVTLVLSVIADAVAGSHAVHPMGANQISVVIGFLFFFLLALTFVMLGDSAHVARRFRRENGGEIGLRELFLAVEKPGPGSFALVIIAAYGVGASANLAEVYRIQIVRTLGTGSATLAPLLRDYMAGHVAQNGPFREPRLSPACT